MLERRNVLIPALLLVIFSLALAVPATAQAQTCSAIVSEALSALGTDCANLSRNTTCYGNEEITKAVFAEVVPAGFYSQAGDRAGLTETIAIQTGPLDQAQGTWGLNVMNVNANVPLEASPKGVVFIQFGGVEVENGVEPADAVEVASVSGELTPMQRFYFNTGIGDVPCAEAPSLLFIQGPNNSSVDLQIFDQHVRIQSTIIVRMNATGDAIELIVLSGLAILQPGTPDEVIVPPGYVTTIALGPELVSLGIEGDADERSVAGTWSTPRPLTAEELAALEVIEEIPGNIINYEIEIPVIVTASSVGGVIPVLVFPNEEALDLAEAACAAGELPSEVCQYLDLAD